MRNKFEDVFVQRQVDIIHSAYVAHTLYQQQKLGKYCDLKVLVGDKQYFVHRCILAAASAQLDSQINGLDTIQLVGVTYYGFECLLEILYSGKLHNVYSLSDSKFQQIVSAADALNAETVMEYCTRERGDLMNTLLRQSNSASSHAVTEKQDQDNSTSNESDHMHVKLEEQCDVIASKLQTSDQAGMKEHVLGFGNRVIKDEIRSNKEIEDDCTEDPVAAEVVVDEFHKKNENNGCLIPSTSSHLMEGEAFDEDDDEDEGDIEDDDYGAETGMTCRVCSAVFLSTADLKTHMHTHIGENLFSCEICGLHFKFQSALLCHKKTHFVCQICRQDFKSSKDLQLHLSEEHPGSNERQYSMDSDRGGSSRSRLAKRKTGVTPSMNRNKPADKPTINPIVVNEIMRGANGKFQCPLCDRGFDRRWNLKCHVLIHTSSKRSTGSAGDARYIEAIFTCPECGKLFRNLHNLRRHASSIHGMNAADLAEASEGQQAEYGTVPKRPKKETVDKDYKYSEDYKFWCSICGRGFKRNRNLRGHMETHQSEGVAKYECPECDRKFAQKESLNGHLWVHKQSKTEA